MIFFDFECPKALKRHGLKEVPRPVGGHGYGTIRIGEKSTTSTYRGRLFRQSEGKPMSEQKNAAEMSQEERRRLLEQKLAEQRKKSEYHSFQESLKQATRVTDSDLRFKVR